MKSRGIVLLDKGTGRDITRRLCRERKIPIGLLDDLVKLELEQVGRLRRMGIFDRMSDIFDEHSIEDKGSDEKSTLTREE